MLCWTLRRFLSCGKSRPEPAFPLTWSFLTSEVEEEAASKLCLKAQVLQDWKSHPGSSLHSQYKHLFFFSISNLSQELVTVGPQKTISPQTFLSEPNAKYKRHRSGSPIWYYLPLLARKYTSQFWIKGIIHPTSATVYPAIQRQPSRIKWRSII